MTGETTGSPVLDSNELLEHWQGHRRLTRRVIEAFPEDQLFTFSIGSMRTFGELTGELLRMAEPMARELVGEAPGAGDPAPTSKAEVLESWDRSTVAIDELWPRIPAARFRESLTVFGQYTGRFHELMLYVIDNEIHHRGQGYVYLRALEVEPPGFWERE